jgi:hypothetical protein
LTIEKEISNGIWGQMLQNPAVIQKILAHLEDNATTAATGLLPQSRAPPGEEFLSEAMNPLKS